MGLDSPLKQWDLRGLSKTFHWIYVNERLRSGGIWFAEEGDTIDDGALGTKPPDEYIVDSFRLKFDWVYHSNESPKKKVCSEISVLVEGEYKQLYGKKKSHFLGIEEDTYGPLSNKSSLAWASARVAVLKLERRLQEKKREMEKAPKEAEKAVAREAEVGLGAHESL